MPMKQCFYIGCELSCLDYTLDEGATYLGDLSHEILINNHFGNGNFDTVLEIGTSEHVGNPFSSLYNAFRLLRDGGYYLNDLPYNG